MKRIMNRLSKVAYGTCVNIYMNVSKPSWSFVGKLQKRIKSILIGIFEIRFNLKRFTLFSVCWGNTATSVILAIAGHPTFFEGLMSILRFVRYEWSWTS